MQKEYNRLMKRCITLAKKGYGRVSPNPLVGAVIFDDDYRIISEGYHAKCGQNHAERNAVLNAKEDLKGKSIIVNLEPCSHFGKTPPCADLIIEKGIKRVISGLVDPNPKVSGRGIDKLKNAGIEVIEGILENECRELNKIFIKNQTEKLPYITIKTAVTMDGKIASGCYRSKWITDEASRKEVHKLRNIYDGILTGSSTIIKDNPMLSCRLKGGRNPVRIIADTNLSCPPNSKVFADDGARVIILTGEKVSAKRVKEYPSNIEIIKCPLKEDKLDIKKAVEILYGNGIMSILVEAGARINKSIIEAELADELIEFIAPKILGDKTGINFVEGFNREEISKCNNLKILSTKLIKNDIMVISRFKKFL